MISKKIISVMKLGLLLSLLVVALLLLAHSLVQRRPVQQFLLGRLSGVIGYKITTGPIHLSLWKRIGLTATNFRARSHIGSGIIEASEVTITLDAGQLIRGRVVPTGVSLYKPKMDLDLTKNSQQGLLKSEILKDSLMKSLSAFPTLTLQKASLRIKGSPFLFQDLNLEIFQKKEHEEKTRLEIFAKCRVVKNNEEFFFKGVGTVFYGGKSDVSGEMAMELTSFPLNWIPWPDEINMKSGRARALLTAKRAREGGVSVDGKVYTKDLVFTLIEGQASKEYSLPGLSFDFESSYGDGILDVSPLKISTSEFTLKAESRLDLNDMSNPALKLKIETPFLPIDIFKPLIPTPLLPDWFAERIFPALQKGRVRVEHFTLNGTLEGIGNLRSQENSGILSTEVSWKGLKLLLAGEGLPFSNVSGKLTVEGGRLAISGVKGTFGLSAVKEASLDVDSLYANVSNYLVSMDGLFHLQDLLRQREITIIPYDVRNRLNRIEPASGKVKTSMRIRYRDDWSQPRIETADFRFDDCTVTQKALFFPLVLDELDLKIGNGHKNEFQARGYWGNTGFEATGSAGEGWKSGEARVTAEADIREILRRFYGRSDFSMESRDPLPCHFSMDWSKESISCRGELDLEGILLETPSLCIAPPGKNSRFHFDLELTGMEAIHLKKGTFYLGDSLINISGVYDIKQSIIKNTAFSSKGTAFEDLGLNLKNEDIEIKGIFSGHGTIGDLDLESPEVFVNGIFEGDDLYLSSGFLPSPFTDCRFRIELSGKQLIVHFLKLNTGRSTIALNGSLKGWSPLKGNLTADAEYLDISDFIPRDEVYDFDEGGSWDRKSLKNLDIGLMLNIRSGLWREMNLNGSRANLYLSDGSLQILSSEIRLDQGSVDLKGNIRGRRFKEKNLIIDFRIADEPVENILKSLRIGEGTLEGLVALHGSLVMKGKNISEMISKMDGKVNLRLDKGKIHKSNVLIRILDFLSLQMIFKKVPKDLSKEGFYFESLECDLEMREGQIRTDNMILRSPVINCAGRGLVDLAKDEVDFDLAVQPLGTIDSLIKRIPVMGYILTGDEGAILVYYFKVTGSLSKHETDYIPLKNL